MNTTKRRVPRLLAGLPFMALLLVGSMSCFGQASSSTGANQQIYKHARRSPEAEAIQKVAEIPVSFHTGVPEISIPIYNIDLPGFTLPISISYNASGLRVEDQATDVGLGWTLNYGGSITQQRYGMNDFLETYGWLHTTEKITPSSYQTFFINNGASANLTPQFSFAARAGQNLVDTQADLFSYSIPGQSGKFYFNQNGKYFFIPKRPNRISYAMLPGSDSTAELTLTDDNANRFIFGVVETAKTIPWGGRTQAHPAIQWAVGTGWLAANDDDYTYKTSRIITRNTDTANFIYNLVGISYNNQPTQTRYSKSDPLLPSIPDVTNLSTTSINQQRISEITTNRGHRIVFVYDTAARKDLASPNLPKNAALKRIDVYFENQLIKQQLFNYDYYTTSGSGTDAFKLRLLSTNEAGQPGHVFTYNGSTLPSWRSYNRDHWGYANDASNTTLLPMDATNGFSTGANREVGSLATVSAGILKEITHPTGGRTVFDYERNDCKFTETKQTTVQITRKALSIPGEVITMNVTIPSGITQLRSFWKGPSVTGTEYVRLINNTTSATLNYTGTSPVNGQLETFAPGSYTFEIYEDAPGGNDYYFQLRWTQTSTVDTTYNKLVGGVRVKSIKDFPNTFDVIPATTRTFNYQSFDNPTFSSGVAGNIPKYVYPSKQFVEGYGVGNIGSYITQVANSILPMNIFQGGVVAYNNITVVDDTAATGAKGAKRYYYSNQAFAKGFEEFPFTPFSYRDWKGGRLDQMRQTGKNGATEFAVTANRNTYYTQDKDDSTEVLSIVFGLEYVWEQIPSTTPPNYQINYKLGTFYHYSGESRLLKEEVIGNSSVNAADSIKSTTDYYYDNPKHPYPTRIVTSLNNLSMATKIRYPGDFDTTLITNAAHKGINYLVNRNWLTAPIENYKQIKKVGATDSLTTEGTLNYYRVGRLLIDSIQTLNIPNPINNFSPATIVSGSLSKNANYKTETVASLYDNAGNVLEQWSKGRRALESFIWDYNQLYVVAYVKGAAYNDIAYTSFEAKGKGNWTFAGAPITNTTLPTGTQCYSLATGAITKAVTSGTVYTVTYWTPNAIAFTISGTQSGYPIKIAAANGWNCFEHKVTGVSTVSISGTGMIDELRLHPFTTSMETNTYKPLVGISAENDQRNSIINYQYDSARRLKTIRDGNWKVLKHFDYRLQTTAAQ